MGKSVHKTEASGGHLLFTAHPELTSPWSLLSWSLLGPWTAWQSMSPANGIPWPGPGFGCWGLPSWGAVESHLPCE